jgi:ATP-dependent helicase/nuclease subunit A
VSSELLPDVSLTPEQRAAIEQREGDLLLDAGAGSGKTTVLVERFVRAVLDDGTEVTAILAITFTEKAAAELRDRIRSRLRSLGAVDAARATEGAFISTIHGFCARLLRANALAAGLDPGFSVLDRPAADRLADRAFDEALPVVAERVPELGELLAAPGGVGAVRGAIAGAFGELRSRGISAPALPPLAGAPVLEPLRAALIACADGAARELGAIAEPGAKVRDALERLGLVREAVGFEGSVPWPGELDAVKLPGGNGAALSTDTCLAYVGALVEFRAACAHRWVAGTWVALDELLREFGVRYAALKRSESGLDFEDLELIARDLLVSDNELRGRYRDRFAQIMVDEFQDTNAVQLELIESIADGNLFTVGDAQQSIYGFRHADVELFERRGQRLQEVGRRLTLSTNFRSRPEILAVINAAFEEVLGERFRQLVPGRESVVGGGAGPLVELIVADKGSEWDEIGIAAPWRIAEARALASRVASLVADGDAAPGEVVVLTRATTDLRAYERALEERGVPTYVIGGRGYWSHPQVVDLVCYLRAVANPFDQEALYTVLASPLVGCCLSTLVILVAAARAAGRDPWWLLRDPGDVLDAVAIQDLDRLRSFAEWFSEERAVAPRCGIEQLVERALERTGYDLAMLAMPGGTRRLANVRKLMRLGRAYEAQDGLDLRGFLALIEGRAGAGDPRESEAPVEGEALNAVRLMTIHRAKGLEFPVVCVADLGRVPWRSAPLLRLGRDDRVGVRLARPGTGRRENTLDYDALRSETLERDAAEERRLVYVAMTRAEERLIVSGAVNLGRWEYGQEPMAWVGLALVPDIAERTEAGVAERGGAEVAVAFVRPDSEACAEVCAPARGFAVGLVEPPPDVPPAPPAPGTPPAVPPVSHLSYSSLGDYSRCGYRFYLQRVLRLPQAPPLVPPVPATVAGVQVAGVSATERGTIVHALLERLDFRRPVVPGADAVIALAAGLTELKSAPTVEEAEEIASLVAAFCASPLCTRLAAASGVRREQRFAFELAGALVIGVVDVLAREPGERALVVDYKSDRLEGAEPQDLITGPYETQRLTYALAALRGGAAAVEVAHVFLERAGAPALATFTRDDVPSLERRLTGLAAGVLERRFAPAAEPHLGLCSGCPGENGLCSWPPAMTRRESVDRLF